MKRTMKIQAILLAMVMTFGLFAFIPPVEAKAATYDGVNSAAKLLEALSASDATVVINITDSFECTSDNFIQIGTQIANTFFFNKQNVTINLNSHTVNIRVRSIIVNPDNVFTVNGPGTLNVNFLQGVYGGINLHEGCVFTTSGGATVNVTTYNTAALRAITECTVNIKGNLSGGGTEHRAIGIEAEGANITIDGNVTGGIGIYARGKGCTVTVTGDVAGERIGVEANGDGSVFVGGNVTGGLYGVAASFSKKTYIIGNISGGVADIFFPGPFSEFVPEGKGIGGTYTTIPHLAFSVSNPPKTVQLDGYNWGEFTSEGHGSNNEAYIYKRLGATGEGTPVTPAPGDTSKITDFVTRLYRNVLDRNPDADSLNAWVSRLASREWGGGEVAETFFFDKIHNEFMNKGLSDGEYLTILYRTFMDRGPDPTGWEAWLDRMSKGMSWKEVFDGFVVSDEWGTRCDAAGIRR